MNTLTAFAPIVNPVTALAESYALHRSCYPLPFHDDYRPTAGPDFIPSEEDEALYLDLLATLDDREDIMAEWAEADRTEAMESAFAAPWDLMSDAELVECGGFHPAAPYED